MFKNITLLTLTSLAMVGIAIAGSESAAHNREFDFKGVFVGAHATPYLIQQKLGVECGLGAAGMQVCNGSVTVADVPTDMNLVINANGNVQRIKLRFNSMFFSVVETAMLNKFGKPKGVDNSVVQNGYGANFQQRVMIWGNAPKSLTLMKYASNVSQSVAYFSSAEEAKSLEKKPSNDL